MKVRRIGIAVCDAVETLDVPGSADLFSDANQLLDPVNDLAQTAGYGGDDIFRCAFERRYRIAPVEYRALSFGRATR